MQEQNAAKLFNTCRLYKSRWELDLLHTSSHFISCLAASGKVGAESTFACPTCCPSHSLIGESELRLSIRYLFQAQLKGLAKRQGAPKALQ